MAIYRYDGTQNNPPNYVGTRIALSINGKLHQKWFKGTDVCEKEVKALHQQWKMEQQLYQSTKARERKELAKNSAYVTGVAGIKMKFSASVKKRDSGKVYRYYLPVFIVSGSTNGERFIKRFNIKKLGYDMAWFKACQYAAEKYGSTLFDKMFKRKPSVKQFQIIHRWQTKCGHPIPLDRLPNELL
jgi:hypothetical protein